MRVSIGSASVLQDGGRVTEPTLYEKGEGRVSGTCRTET